MKIVIDARFWGPSHTGLGVYTRELVNALAKVDKKNRYILLVRQKMTDAPAKMAQVVVDAGAYTIKEQISVAAALYKLRPNLVHFPSINVPIFYFGKFVVTVHDLIKHESRGTMTSTHNSLVYWPKYLVYHLVTAWAIYRALKILVPSQDVKNKIVSFYKVSPDRISVTYEAAVLPARVETAVNLPAKFAFYAGNAYPHKNLNRLVRVWKTVFVKTKTKLAIASGRSVFWQRVEKLAGPNVIHLGHLDDQQLTFVHRRASLYVFPSLAEGFGIPALDAMKIGVPVACSDLPVFHEVYGDAAYYFDPQNEADIADKIIKVLTDADLSSDLVKKGKIQAAKYSWAKTAKQTLQAYESCSSL